MALIFIDQQPEDLPASARRRTKGKSLYAADMYQGSPEEKAYEEMPFNQEPSVKLAPSDLMIRPVIPEQERVKVKGGNPWDYEKWQKLMMVSPESPVPII